ncbi:RVT_1 domain-containing protein, partial [Cephalotus follicularis]
ELRMAI